MILRSSLGACLALSVFANVAVCAEARADESVEVVAEPQNEQPDRLGPNMWDAPFAFELHVGAYGPVGGLGVAVMLTPTPYLSFMAGFGATVSGWRAGAGIRLFYPVLSRLGVGLEAWYAYGTDFRPLFKVPWGDWDRASWQGVQTLRLVVTLEYRAHSGFRLRGYIGGAGHLACDDPGCPDMPPTTPTLGLAIGWAFGGSGGVSIVPPDAYQHHEGDPPMVMPPRLPDI